MKTSFQLLLTAAAMSTCFAHAAETIDPLGPLPGEAPAAAKAVPVKTAPAPAKSATSQPAINAPTTPAVIKPSTPPSAEPANAPSFAAKPPGAVGTPAAAPAISADTQQKVVTPPPQAVQAQIVVPAPDRTYTQTSNATFLQMDRLRSANAILVEQVRQKELMDKLNPPAVVAPTPATPTLTPANTALSAGANIRPNMVLSIYGIDDELTAVISTTGAPLKVKVGNHVPGLGQVKSISREGVTVSSKKSTMALEMAPISTFPGAR